MVVIGLLAFRQCKLAPLILVHVKAFTCCCRVRNAWNTVGFLLPKHVRMSPVLKHRPISILFANYKLIYNQTFENNQVKFKTYSAQSYNQNNGNCPYEPVHEENSAKPVLQNSNTDSGSNVHTAVDINDVETFGTENNSDIITVKSAKKINVLAPPESPDDVEFIAPQLRPTFNLAAYADKSDVLKNFINLGVEIARWEKDKDICFHILRMDFEKDIKPYIFFLNDIGIPAQDMGQWLTKNPHVFKERIEDLNVRINYLESKKFSKDKIASVINRVPKWININTVTVDRELGIYQRRFRLAGQEVRHLVLTDPKLVVFTISNTFHLQRMSLALEKELGFTKKDMKTLLLSAPRIYRTNGTSLFRRFDVVHLEMGLSHEVIVKFPTILLHRDCKLTERHKFLSFLGKAQYSPEKPHYVSPETFIRGTDAEFCINVAGSSIDVYNDFLKTL